ncbi:glycosyl transferase [Candidatus Amesbacteria bacterium RIFCSPHIGHO2_02_FULL_47_9]|uniref:Glycosyl transferase n=1 Tax=Candidatus Amesbacteria bacterium RIFCSPHIGHO2_01_FULL_48_32b TaxID=1797253 RepID=A0A1F4YDW7_9BACT|nr:MAG: glycosyl transferase [Candidatus Amesbacteria bacterium RIFCSPHIGHO2_01_FULL_48_32b]OGD02338.1 MAG: glycosyl transferase [Candidatus Amesbacteria bacterium RIFCSPHIGHO2_02_FULL_47_9]OGD08481.1 MAG: glycosyl transferase [Candidatus Amesbacteria bacterium RIFCSPLOWO2_01_FULL_49_25]
MKLSVIIPVYNEERTVEEIIRRVAKVKIKKEIIVVNDGSMDGTGSKVRGLKIKNLRIIDKRKNEGKGAAIRDALKMAAGDVVVIQDADLEYDPQEYKLLLEPITKGRADVVFGSRLLSARPHRVMYFWHYVGNLILTLLTNVLTNLNLTDMETCYKAFSKDVAKKLDIREKRFGFEPEFTVKVAKMGCRIYEVGISYSGRSYAEGKKISWRDGLKAIWCLLRYAWSSDDFNTPGEGVRGYS